MLAQLPSRFRVEIAQLRREGSKLDVVDTPGGSGIAQGSDQVGLRPSLRGLLVVTSLAWLGMVALSFHRASAPSSVVGLAKVMGSYVELVLLSITALMLLLAAAAWHIRSALRKEAHSSHRYAFTSVALLAYTLVVAFWLWFISHRSYWCLSGPMSKKKAFWSSAQVIGVPAAGTKRCSDGIEVLQLFSTARVVLPSLGFAIAWVIRMILRNRQGTDPENRQESLIANRTKPIFDGSAMTRGPIFSATKLGLIAALVVLTNQSAGIANSAYDHFRAKYQASDLLIVESGKDSILPEYPGLNVDALVAIETKSREINLKMTPIRYFLLQGVASGKDRFHFGEANGIVFGVEPRASTADRQTKAPAFVAPQTDFPAIVGRDSKYKSYAAYLASNADDVMIGYSVAKAWGVKVGDSLTFDVGRGNGPSTLRATIAGLVATQLDFPPFPFGAVQGGVYFRPEMISKLAALPGGNAVAVRLSAGSRTAHNQAVQLLQTALRSQANSQRQETAPAARVLAARDVGEGSKIVAEPCLYAGAFFCWSDHTRNVEDVANGQAVEVTGLMLLVLLAACLLLRPFQGIVVVRRYRSLAMIGACSAISFTVASLVLGHFCSTLAARFGRFRISEIVSPGTSFRPDLKLRDLLLVALAVFLVSVLVVLDLVAIRQFLAAHTPRRRGVRRGVALVCIVLLVVLGCIGSATAHDMDNLVQHRNRYGANWDWQPGANFYIDASPIAPVLDGDPLVEKYVMGTSTKIRFAPVPNSSQPRESLVDAAQKSGVVVDVLGVSPHHPELRPPVDLVVSHGHSIYDPANAALKCNGQVPFPVMLGTRTLDAIPAHVGDCIVGLQPDGPLAYMRITGVGPMPDFGLQARLSEGAITTFEALKVVNPRLVPNGFLIKFKGGLSTQATAELRLRLARKGIEALKRTLAAAPTAKNSSGPLIGECRQGRNECVRQASALIDIALSAYSSFHADGRIRPEDYGPVPPSDFAMPVRNALWFLVSACWIAVFAIAITLVGQAPRTLGRSAVRSLGALAGGIAGLYLGVRAATVAVRLVDQVLTVTQSRRVNVLPSKAVLIAAAPVILLLGIRRAIQRQPGDK
jgi:hypothetical protein